MLLRGRALTPLDIHVFAGPARFAFQVGDVVEIKFALAHTQNDQQDDKDEDRGNQNHHIDEDIRKRELLEPAS